MFLMNPGPSGNTKTQKLILNITNALKKGKGEDGKK